MKFVLALLCLVPLASCLIFDTLFNGNEVHSLVNAVVEKFGTDATEKQCEQECLVLFTSDILDKGCDFACLEIQSLIKKLHS